MAMNRTEFYAALSYNPETDFEDAILESVMDDAEAQLHTHRGAEYGIESVMRALEADVDEDLDDDETTEDAMEGDYEKKSFFKKVELWWKRFVDGAMSFFRAIGTAIQNLGTSVKAWSAKKKLANRTKKVSLPQNFIDIMDNVGKLRGVIKETKYSSIKEMNHATAASQKSWVEDSIRTRKSNTTMHEVEDDYISKYLTETTKILQETVSSLKTFDSDVRKAIKDDDQEVSRIAKAGRSRYSTFMNIVRKSVVTLSKAIGLNDDADKVAKAVKQATDSVRDD